MRQLWNMKVMDCCNHEEVMEYECNGTCGNHESCNMAVMEQKTMRQSWNLTAMEYGNHEAVK